MRVELYPRVDPRSWKATESVLLTAMGFGSLWKWRGRDGAPGRGKLWGHWNAAGNRWRKPRGAKGWGTEVKLSDFIRIPEKKQPAGGWGWSLGKGNGGRGEAGD